MTQPGDETTPEGEKPREPDSLSGESGAASESATTPVAAAAATPTDAAANESVDATANASSDESKTDAVPAKPRRERRARGPHRDRRRGTKPGQELSIDFGSPTDRPEDRWAIRFWRSVVILISRLFHQLLVRNRNPLPESGPAILVSNHISALDPVLLQAASSRLVIWMMAREYYDLKSLNWFFKIVRAIPVTRGAHDTSATRLAIRALHAGRVLGVFPEGRIETSQDLLEFHIGVAMMAIKTGVPVYPAYLEGTTRGKEMVEAVVKPNTISLRFGPRIEFDRSDSSKEGLIRATDQIQAAVEKLRQQEIDLRSRLASDPVI